MSEPEKSEFDWQSFPGMRLIVALIGVIKDRLQGFQNPEDELGSTPDGTAHLGPQ